MTETPAGLRSYRPGDWYAVLGEDVAVLVPPTERARVAVLWELVDGGADADELLDALIAGGLRSLPGFVLLADAGDRVRVILRGAVRAGIDTHDGPVALDGGDATTWVERVLPGVTAVRIDVAEHADGADRPIDAGLVRVGRLDRPPYVEPEPEPAPAPAPEPPPDLTPEPEPHDALTEAIDLSGLPDLPRPPMPPTMPPPAVPPPVEPTAMTFGWGAGDHDGTTRTPGPADAEPERPRPGIPGQPPAPAVTEHPVARLDFSGGDVVDVDRVVLVGRAPEARRFTETEETRLVAVPSPHQEISSTHLEIRPGSGSDHGSAVVTDLGSTNGTLLVQPGLSPEVLQPGVAVQLLPGAVVDLGDGVTIRVSHP